MPARQPTVFLPHGGGPCFFMTWNPPDTWARMGDWLRTLQGQLPEPPRALLVISAHWEAAEVTVQTHPNPPLIYDYNGFPPHTYALTWPAPGAPALAAKVQSRLQAAGIPCRADARRGFDHGVFIPLKLAFPAADIPTVQLSLKAGLDPATHLAMGAALQDLRDDGVLIMGSGMSDHNMARLMAGGTQVDAPSAAFGQWLQSAVTAPAADRWQRLLRWTDAPHARDAHPREEHLLPLHVAAGAAGEAAGRIAFEAAVLGTRQSGFIFGE